MVNSGDDGVLADRFLESKGQPVVIGDRTVQLALDLTVGAEVNHVNVRVLRAKDTPVQGVCLKISNAKLKVAGQISPGVVLWTDTVPPVVRVDLVARSKRAPVLRVWNCWKGRHGEVQAWLRNGGLFVESIDSCTFLIKGNAGPHDLDFQSIEFEVTLGS